MTQTTDSADSRTYVNVPMSEKFKDAFAKWCDRNGYKIMARAGQKALADLIGYDLSTEPEPRTKSKYGSDETGKVDREAAKLTNSFKGAEQTRLLRLQLKAKMHHDTAKVAAIDLELDALLAKDWEPTLAKQIEIRARAIAKCITAKEIPADYEDDTLDELQAKLFSADSAE